MSYCRLGDDSDVYLFPSYDVFICYMCKLRKDENNRKFKTLREVLKHLNRHIKAGHKVPKYAFDRIKKEME